MRDLSKFIIISKHKPFVNQFITKLEVSPFMKIYFLIPSDSAQIIAAGCRENLIRLTEVSESTLRLQSADDAPLATDRVLEVEGIKENY